jgi:acetylornithine deacetylase/succinyl-diaminopimelate desuccinylase-like protein
MGGGLSVNAIPQHAWIEIDVRSSSAPVLATLGARIAAIVRQATIAENQRSAPGMAPLRSSLAGIGDRPCGEVSESDPLVQTAMEFTRLAGRQPELAMSSTDANVPISLGIPAIAIGAGGKGGDTHTTAEWFEDIEGMRGVARAMAILLSVAAKAA